MMRMIIFATLRGDQAAAGAGNPLIGQIGDQDITGLDRAVRHDHRHQGHDHRHQGHDHRHQGHDHCHQDHDHRHQGHDHYDHREDLPPWLDRAVLQDHYLSHDHLCLQNHQQSNAL